MAQYLLKKGIAFIKLSNPPVNSLSKNVRVGIMRGLDAAKADKADCVVLHGDGKAFSAGADIAEFATGGHLDTSLGSVLDRLDAFDLPVISYITGVALGGGLETALATHWRVASPKALVGLPEVHLGILPGAGGTQRLPRLCAIPKAVEIMTSGRMVSAQEALESGIVDRLAARHDPSPEELEAEMLAFTRADGLLDCDLALRRVSLRPVLGGQAEVDAAMELVRKSSRGMLAPGNIVRAVGAAVECGPGAEGFARGLRREGELFTELAKGPQARALQYFFFSERKVNTAPKVPDVPTVTNVGIIGGGTMGAGIAMSFLDAKIPVTLVETDAQAAEAARNRIEQTYKASSAYRQGRMSAEKLDVLLGGLTVCADMSALAESDLVVEAAFENSAVKREIFARLDKICKPDAVLATNTSCLDIDEIAGATSPARRPNVVGTHFFSPANVMKLLEIVRGAETSKRALAACVTVGKRIGKVSAVAGNCYGFIGNRMLEPYGREAINLLEEGCSPAQVDRALKATGLAMGFFEMCDLAGNDISWRQRQERGLTGAHRVDLATINSERSAKSPDYPGMRYCALPDRLCERGRFGQKTKGGWYDYSPDAPRKPVESPTTLTLIEEHRASAGVTPREISDEEIVERCLYSLINEGCRIVEEGVATDLASVDVVYVYGYGFPRGRGGPMFWAKNELGYGNVVRALERHAEKHPAQPWLRPSRLLVELAAAEAKERA